VAAEAGGTGAVERAGEWVEFPLGAGRARLFARIWRPAAPNGCVLYCVHGVASTGADFAFLGRYLGRRGYTVIAPDLVGHGRSTGLGGANAYGTGTTTRTLIALTRHYAGEGGEMAFLGSSGGATQLALFLASTGAAARAVVLNDFALEWSPRLRTGAQRFVRQLTRRFDTLAAAKAHLRRCEAEMFHHQDDDEIAPAVHEDYLASHFRAVDGKFAYAIDTGSLHTTMNGMDSRKPFPDFHKAISTINSRNILLLFGEHSQHRVSAVRDRLAAGGRVAILEVPRAGHSPRLLSLRQARIVQRFLDRARAG
jgi:pimeloyl-ACP methyl ester carboxylesterase